MADKFVTHDVNVASLASAGSVSSGDTILVVQGGVHKKANVSQLPSGVTAPVNLGTNGTDTPIGVEVEGSVSGHPLGIGTDATQTIGGVAGECGVIGPVFSGAVNAAIAVNRFGGVGIANATLASPVVQSPTVSNNGGISFQTASPTVHLLFGVGAPSTTYVDGSIYIRTDGGSMTTVYQQRSGSWVGIV